ncbi:MULTISPECIES: inositol monophosphatase family protein [Parafrankia]|uniref:inositol monophosphatase family protein n=1 Tax=Parafrankia TaxID=2994362 RepID=UPI000B85764E|nr:MULTISPECIES: inositol monophosphatase family protein [Parafrankia]MBE3202057.1 inositol monophosphatase [Parafrankia sp. CH37]
MGPVDSSPDITTPPAAAELLGLGLDVAREAGALLLAGREGTVEAEATKSSPTDIVTALDRASEALVSRRLREARPQDGLLGEEGSDTPGTSGVRWIVDPLDGTVNFLYRLPNWAVSIAAEVAGEVVAGVVHAPALGLTYTAVRGGGALRWTTAAATAHTSAGPGADAGAGTPGEADPEKLTGSTVTDLRGALVATGFGYTEQRRTAQVAVLTRVVPRVRDIRRMGAAALDLCAAAAGTVDAYYERGLHPWDHAAGALVASEAGLRVGGLDGRAPGEDLVVAAPPPLFDALTALLAEHPRADSD